MYEIKKTYTDWDGNERTETLRFNLTQTELTEIEANTPGGLQNYMKEISEKADGAKIMKFVKDFIAASYGEKDADGRRFRKSEEITRSFEETCLYDDLFTELVLNVDKLVDFINNVCPDESKMEERLAAAGISLDKINQNGPSSKVIDMHTKNETIYADNKN